MLTVRSRLRLGLRDGRAACKATGLRRARDVFVRASFAGQGGPYGPGPDVPGTRGLRGRHGPMGQRRMTRQPRDLQQLLDDLINVGAVEDPEQFLRLVSAAPRVLDRRRAPQPVPPPPPPPPPPAPPRQDPAAAAAAYRRLQQQQQQQAVAAAAAEAEALRRRAQMETQGGEEERRREALRTAMLQSARRLLPQYDASSLARLASALAAAGVHDPELCDDMVQQLVSQTPQPARPQPQQQLLAEPRSVADLLDAFAAMRHRPSDAQMAQLLLLHQAQQQQQQQQLLQQQQQLLLQQQKTAEMQRRRQQQQQQQLLRLQPRGMGYPTQPQPAAVPQVDPVSANGSTSRGAGGPSSMSPEDAARMLYALSRLGYTPDDRTMSQLLEQLQPQRLRLQPLPPQVQSRVGAPAGTQVAQAQAVRQPAATSPSLPRAGKATAAEAPNEAQAAVAAGAGAEEEEDGLSYSLQRDAQAVASAVRALERMGRLGEAQELREQFMRHVQEVQARVAADRRDRRRQEEEEAAATAQAAERERRTAAEAAMVERQRERERERERQAAAVAAAQAERETRAAEEAEMAARRRQRQEEQARALRVQLTRKLRTADTWQQIRVLLVTYQDALGVDCVAAAAVRLSELLTAARRTGRGLGLRDRGELGDLLEGLGELALKKLDAATVSQAASLLSSVVRMRYLEERLLVGLLRRLRDTLGDATSAELAAVLGALAECGVRPTPPWMETFLARCEDMLEAFTPDDLAALPVCLSQLGAHPGRSWLGSYLDVLQEREGELSQSSISEAVHAVALLDRQFLVAWRQAAAVRQQQQQAAQAQAQRAQIQARADGGATQAAAQEQQSANALASVDEMLAMPDPQQPWAQQPSQVPRQPAAPAPTEADAIKVPLPPMHPKQRSMEAESGRAQSLQEDKAQPADVSYVGPAGRLKPLGAATASIELDVDSAGVPYADWAVPSAAATGAPVPSAQLEKAAATSSAQPAGLGLAATTAPVASAGGRQLPGSYSIDGYYSLDPFDEYEAFDEFDEMESSDGSGLEAEERGQEEGKVVEGPLESAGLVLDEKGAEVMANAKVRAAKSDPNQTEADAAQEGASEADNQEGTSSQGRQQQQHQQAQQSAVGSSRISINLGSGMAGASDRAQPQPAAGQQGERPAAMGSVDVPEWEDEARTAKAAPKVPAQQQQEQEQAPKTQPKPEDLAKARALRSVLLERYEAVAAFKEELEERRRCAKAAEAVAEAEPSPYTVQEAAAALRLLEVKKKLEQMQTDYENFKRRADIESEQATARAKADILRPLLGVADNFERAATQIKPSTDGERAVQEAYQAVSSDLEAFLKREGLIEIGGEGEAFDPTLHEAVMREDRTDVPDGTVTGVFQKGYRLGELLVRPALVKVASS